MDFDTSTLNDQVKQRVKQEISSGANYDQVAETMGITRETLDSWLPEIKDDIEQAVEELREQTKRRVVNAGSEATDTLIHIMHHAEDEELRLEAAKFLLDKVYDNHEDAEQEITEGVVDVLAADFGFIIDEE